MKKLTFISTLGLIIGLIGLLSRKSQVEHRDIIIYSLRRQIERPICFITVVSKSGGIHVKTPDGKYVESNLAGRYTNISPAVLDAKAVKDTDFNLYVDCGGK